MSDARISYIVQMPYIGNILSVNNYKFGTRGTKPYVKMWMRELAERANKLEIPQAEEYDIELFARFTDERRPDLSNLHKVIGDALQEGLGIDDKHIFFSDKGYELGHLDQSLTITIIPRR